MIVIQRADEKDVAELARLNALLDEAVEGSCQYERDALESAMTHMLKTHHAYFFKIDGKTVGYCLCDITRDPYYIRQFYIDASERRKGLGKQAFEALCKQLGTDRISLDCHLSNVRALAFWEGLGFRKHHVHMIREE